MKTIAGVVLALVSVTAAVRATVVLPADLTDLTLGARAIAHGRVISVDSRWATGRRYVETLVRLDVTDYLKGDLGPALTFKVPGGDLGTYRTMVIGAPRFAVGDEVVLFLGADGPSIPHVLGLGQGVFRVVADAEGRPLVVPPPLLRGTVAQRVTRGDPTRGPIGLEAFAGVVNAALAAGNRDAAAPATRTGRAR